MSFLPAVPCRSYTVERALKSIPDFQRTGSLGKGDGSAVGRTLGCFLASTDEAPTATHVCSKDLQEGKSSVRCVTYARMLWSGMQKQPGAVGHVRVSHDGYLKMFQLGLRRGIYKSAFAKWDCVMLDEGHDCTDAMVDACHAPCRAKTASFITVCHHVLSALNLRPQSKSKSTPLTQRAPPSPSTCFFVSKLIS